MIPQNKAKIKWHCRRGMLELDIILGRFAEKHLQRLTNSQLESFEHLLGSSDPDLYSWLMGYATPLDKDLNGIIEYIRATDNVK